ncbi:MAG: ZIP family metal transporter [bacterium]
MLSLDPVILTLLSVLVVSLISFVGVINLAFGSQRIKSTISFMVSFAVGGLFGDAFIHLLPEAYVRLGTGLNTALYVIGGIFIFFILEKFMRWRHCHDNECEEHNHPVAATVLVGDAFHNFFDGMLIAASYLISPEIGIATTTAVVLHEIPHEMGNFAVLIHSGYTVKKALIYNFISALTAFVGAIVSLVAGSGISNYSLILIPITAGGFIYIAGSDLLPELHHETRASHSLKQLLAIALGVLIMVLLALKES